MNQNPVDVFLLDPLGIIGRGDQYTIDRHRTYHLKFTEKFPKSTFRVLSIGENTFSNLTENGWLWYLSRKSPLFFTFFIKSCSIIKKSQNPEKVLVSGDPWLSGMIAILIKFLGISKEVKVQIQCHADFLNPLWSRRSIRRRMKVFLGSQVIKRADSIRVVSNTQKTYFPAKLFSRIFVSPVLLNLIESKKVSNFEQRPLTVGLVGRIDKDRGIDRFISWITELNTVNTDFNVVLIGDGPMLSELQKELKTIIGGTRIASYGHLSPQELADAWENIGILWSTAPTESFGRTVREAIWHGVPVLAQTSSGIRELSSFVDERFLKVVDYHPEGRELIISLEKSLHTNRDLSISREIENQNSASLEILIDSWKINEK